MTKIMFWIQITTTTEKKEQAEAIARCLVEEKLAACVQITAPVTSIYRWQGKVETALEYLLMIKTRADLSADVEAVIKKLHPYDVPEIIAVPMVNGSKEYLQWLDESLQ